VCLTRNNHPIKAHVIYLLLTRVSRPEEAEFARFVFQQKFERNITDYRKIIKKVLDRAHCRVLGNPTFIVSCAVAPNPYQLARGYCASTSVTVPFDYHPILPSQ
jgi:hypothetical protein